jgi:hypothetical protein
MPAIRLSDQADPVAVAAEQYSQCGAVSAAVTPPAVESTIARSTDSGACRLEGKVAGPQVSQV